jgi:hypothetical protein
MKFDMNIMPLEATIPLYFALLSVINNINIAVVSSSKMGEKLFVSNFIQI